MRLIKLNIVRFGKLNNVTVDLNEGLNVYIGRNGSGKSTTAAFIKAMLYGFDYNRSDSLRNKHHEKYRTWDSTEKFGGSLILKYKEREYEVSRYFGTNRSQESFSVIDLGTNMPSNVFEKGVGETIFNLDSSGFDRCFYVPQYEVSVSSNDTFISKLSDLIEDSNEISFDKAMKRLDAKRSELRKNGGGGKLDQLERDMITYNDRISRTKLAYKDIAEVDLQINEVRKQLHHVDLQLNKLSQSYNQMEQSRVKDMSLSKLEFAHLQEQQASQECDRLAQTIKGQVQDVQQLNMLNSKVSEYCMLENNLLVTGFSPNRTLMWVIFAIMTALCLAFAIIGGEIFFYILSAVFGVFAIGVLIYLLIKQDKGNLVQNKQQQILQMLNRYFDTDSVSSGMDLVNRYNDYYNNINEYKLSLNLLSQSREAIKRISENRDTNNFNIDKYNTVKENVERLEAHKAKLSQQLASLISSNETSLKYVDNLSSLQSVVDEMAATREKMIKELSASYCSMMLLSQARRQLSTRYIPSMCKELSKQIAYITDGEWSRVEVGGDLNPDNITLVEKDKRRNIDYFSKGIKEICLFTLRLGLAKQLYRDNIPLLILDDPFVNYDEEKFTKVCQILQDLSKSTQIIIFSCHQRSKLLTSLPNLS